MYTHFFEIRMYRLDNHYWTIGIKVVATDFLDAIKQVNAWSFGIKAFSSLRPSYQSIHDVAVKDRGYWSFAQHEELENELRNFLLKTEE